MLCEYYIRSDVNRLSIQNFTRYAWCCEKWCYIPSLRVRNVYPRTHIFQHFIFIFVCSALNVVTFPILYAAWLCNDKSDMVCRRIKAYKVIHKLISDFIRAVDAFTIFPTWMLKNIQLLLVYVTLEKLIPNFCHVLSFSK